MQPAAEGFHPVGQPAEPATAVMVLLINTDTLVGTAAQEPSSLLGTTITTIATPGHVYGQ